MSDKKAHEKKINILLERLNRDIEEFIRDSIESSFDIQKVSFLSNGCEPVRCWEIKGCEKEKCPAHSSEDHRCWLQVGTLCGGKVQGEFAKKYKTCFECDVLKIISGDPVRMLCENINTLIFHLKDKTIKFHELAIKDPLTGLYNRHFFNEIIEREMASIERKSETLSFIMIDIDHFKEINDTLGHLAGDKVLIEAATLIKNTARKADLAFRFGGDEFLVLLTNADCDKTTNMVGRLGDAIELWNKDNANAYGCRLSFSIGCSTCGKECDIHSALKDADEKMYQNKKEKKNGVK